jgi:hypothetical protein
MVRNRFKILIIILLGLLSCKGNDKKTEAQKIVIEWMEKEIQFPAEYQCNILGKDTVASPCNELFNAEYKVLLYIDSLGCTGCRLKLFQWKQIIEESDSLFAGKLNFLFFLQPKDKKELNFLLKRDKFDYPVFIDTKNSINQLNRFPDQPEYQCFLLDKNNKILMIGNPSLNPKIWELYKQTISDDNSENKQPLTRVSVEQPEIELTDLVVGKTSVAVFKLKNTGNNPLIIYSVNASCGCTVPTWEKKPVEPGAETEIKVEIQPEELGVFNKTIQVYANTEENTISLVVKGTINKLSANIKEKKGGKLSATTNNMTIPSAPTLFPSGFG